MTFFAFRKVAAWILFAVMVFSVLAFGTVETWAEMTVELLTFGMALVWIGWTLNKRKRTVGHWLVLAPAAIVIVASAQLILDLAGSRYRTVHDLMLWVVYTVFLLLCINVFQDRWIRQNFAHGRTLLCFAVATAALVQHYLSPGSVYGLRDAPDGSIFGPFIDRNHYAIFVELTLPWALILAFRATERRALYFVFCGLMVASVVVSGSRAGMAIVAVEFICVVIGRVLWRERRESRGMFGIKLDAAVLGPAAIIALLGLSVVSTTALHRFSPDDLERGLERTKVAAVAWRMFAEKPLLGHGLGSFDAVYPSFAETYDGFRWHHVHNDSAELAMELGIVGIGIQVIVIGWVLLRRHSRDIWARSAPSAGRRVGP